MWPVVWKASSTMFPSWSEAAWWNTAKMFFQPERMLAAWEFTIWAMQRITMSRMVGDLRRNGQPCHLYSGQWETYKPAHHVEAALQKISLKHAVIHIPLKKLGTVCDQSLVMNISF